MRSRLFAMLIVAFSPFSLLFSQSEFLDSTFGYKGRQFLHFLPSDDQGFAVLYRPDGRILVAGRSVADSANQFSVVQYLPDGRLDHDFDIDGKRTVNFGAGQEIAYAAALLPDGRAVVAGFAGDAGFEDFAVTRLTPEGQPDVTFAGTGKASYDFNFGMDYAYAVMLQPDGKIVLAGYTSPDGFESDFALLRLLPNGQPDPDFGVDGRVVQSFSAVSDLIFDAKLQPDGKIVVAGQVYNDDFSSDFIVARYRSDGQLDTDFADNGVARFDLGNDDLARGIALQSDGKIVAAGVTTLDFFPRVGVVRLLPNGLADDSFGNNGILTIEPGPAGNFCTDVLAHPDGGILLSGMLENTDFRDFFLLRLLPDGSPDISFGNAGQVISSVSPTNDNAYRMAVDAAGDILLAGTSERTINADFALLHYSADGHLDTDFGQNGVVLTDVDASFDLLYKMLLLPDEKILCAGSAYKAAGSGFEFYPGILRLQPNGAPDASFGQAESFLNPPAQGTLLDIVRASDGKIAGAGMFNGVAGLIRLEENGQPDATFGANGIATSSFGEGSSYHALALTPDGKLLAAGASPLPVQEGVMVRYTSQGAFDLSFGLNGQAQAPAGFLVWEQLHTLSDGKFLALGSRWVNGSIRDYLVQFLENGSVDLNFGSGGLVIDAGMPGSQQNANTFLRLPSGKLLVAGGGNSFAFAQLLPNGALDPSFGTNGFIAHTFGNDDNAIVVDLAVQADGRIVAVGKSGVTINADPDFQIAITRLLPDGSLDTDFGINGIIRLAGKVALQVIPLDNDQLLVGGQQNNGQNDDVVLVRLVEIPSVGVVDATSTNNLVVSLYPNPVSSAIQLKYELLTGQTVRIDCYDETGRLMANFLPGVARQAGAQQETIELPAHWPAGVYTLTLHAGAGSQSLKFVKL